ncbi:MAG: hypothetical protein LBC84_08410 [Prevotellaceae bacterium]|jgi:hypothetical protein|nr:hypothetical protein [Prevotellaceae bacterium]
MKKISIALFATMLLPALSTCSSEGPFATVEVTVTNLLLNPVKGATVYLFLDAYSLLSKPENAKRKLATNADGIAVFRIDLDDKEITEMETELFFVVFQTFGGVSLPVGSDPIKVRRNDEISVALKFIP